MTDAAMDTPLPRQVADAYVDALIRLDPIVGTFMGDPLSSGRLPDLSPDGHDAMAALARTTLTRLSAAEALPGGDGGVERRCAGLLRERLTAGLDEYEAGEELRRVDNISSPLHRVRKIFALMPTNTEDDWAALAQRLRAVPGALEGYRASLAEGARRGLPAGPRQVAATVAQLTEWLAIGGFAVFTADGPESLRGELAAAAEVATAAAAETRDWFRDRYAAAVAGAPDVVGPERYVRAARVWNGTRLDLDEAYAYGWDEFHRLREEMRAEAEKVLPGAASPWEAMSWLDRHGQAVEGVEEVRGWLQELMGEAIAALDGTHFELAEQVKRVESRIAPPGGAAAPYYTQPALDFSRPGRTWLPTLGRTRFPVHGLVSTWYHEGVPGHHLQLAQWTLAAGSLSRYQTKVGKVGATVEGWALYAERLMDELGFLTDPARRLGHLDAQMMRAVRVVIDIGTHLGLEIPRHSPFHPGERWTPGLAREFLGRHSGRSADYLDSEITRYLGRPGQAIGYKLGERAWLRGRAAARARHGAAFSLKEWHMKALALGSLGLDDLERELAAL
ncbi:DUF885 domain-containing protein [Streptomyces sp. UNOB3_S3]|uniref:DUF885 domain-containing protein n=1 Tax=Streptomyces sp. UNOB3_S3 TaxID=2871682 RepID=UPI001E36E403|nr:DUF885 domain-containing protein [Streptomyces sp. UNOB3_S3]MCC3778233.1 DUF885 domain-containing protein [Streptomyces sp. UNOB3_S3]